MVEMVQEDEFNKDELDTKKDLVIEEDEVAGITDDDTPLVETPTEDEDDEDKDEDDDLTTYLFGDDYE